MPASCAAMPFIFCRQNLQPLFVTAPAEERRAIGSETSDQQTKRLSLISITLSRNTEHILKACAKNRHDKVMRPAPLPSALDAYDDHYKDRRFFVGCGITRHCYVVVTPSQRSSRCRLTRLRATIALRRMPGEDDMLTRWLPNTLNTPTVPCFG